MMLREVVAGGKHLESEVMDKPVRMLEAVQSIVARGVSARATSAPSIPC